MNQFKTTFLTALCASLVLPAPAVIAQDAAQQAEVEKRQLTLDELRTFTDVFNLARRNYIDNVDDKTLLDAAIRGMLADLDPHSAYLPPEGFEALNDASRGRYSGIGVKLTTGNRYIEVDAVVDGSPADEAGIRPGDVITSVNGDPVRGRNITDSIDAMDGEPGTGLMLRVRTPDGDERELELTREYIRVPNLSFEWLDQGYGYFRLGQFHRESARNMEDALESVSAEGKALNALVLDLRNNPGGVLQPAIDIADGFLQSGRIVMTRGRNETMQMEFDAHPGEWLPGVPVVILVDRGSASASEVLAGALQDHGRALVVGERTFGKGSVQSVLPLRNGGGIKLTTAHYYTPSGRSIQARGINPDIEIESGDEPDDREREGDLERHLASPEWEPEAVEKLDMEFPVDEILSVLEEADLID